MRKFIGVIRFPDREDKTFIVFADSWTKAVYLSLEEVDSKTIDGRLFSITEDLK
jgi:hypothetical protein